MKVWITKYALTQGILEVEGVPYPAWFSGVGYNGWRVARRNDWHTTRDQAVERAETMRRAAIAKLERLTWEQK